MSVFLISFVLQVFVLVSYYQILRQTMTVFFPQGIAQIAEAQVSINRLQVCAFVSKWVDVSFQFIVNFVKERDAYMLMCAYKSVNHNP